MTKQAMSSSSICIVELSSLVFDGSNGIGSGRNPLKTAKRTVRLIPSASAEDTVRLATLIARAEHFGGEEVKIATKKGIFLAIAERLLEWRTPSDLFLVLANRFGVADVTACPPPWSTGSMHPSWSEDEVCLVFHR